MSREQLFSDFGVGFVTELYEAVGVTSPQSSEYANRDVVDMLKDAALFILDDQEQSNNRDQLSNLISKATERDEVIQIMSDNFSDEEIQNGIVQAMVPMLHAWKEKSEGQELDPKMQQDVKGVLQRLKGEENNE